MTEQRRLAAILVADVVGYSKLIGRDETGTLAQLQALRTDIIEPQIANHAGRLFKAVGDGFLIEFASAIQAVTCAKAIQDANALGHLPLRIGIHVGDVVIQGDDLMGDGINVAARLESVADPGGISLSRQVHDQVRDKLDLPFIDKGEVELKNIARAVQVFVIGTAKSELPASAQALPDKPSIAVLPFQNMSGDPGQEYFADGIAEDIITNLSKFREFNVIARNSCFAYKGERLNISDIGRSLNSEYIVEGSVRTAGNRVRITAQLSSASSGTHLWADRFDRELNGVFEVQDEITTRIATAINPAIRDAETKRALRKHPADLGSWDHLLRGLWYLNAFKKEANAVSRREFRSAIERDPSSAAAHAWIAMSHVFEAWFNWTQSHVRSFSEAHREAAKAVKLDAQEPVAHIATAFASFWTGRMEQARSSADLAVSLNPSAFLAYFTGGAARNYLGQCEAAVPMHLKALDLSPNDPLVWNCLGSLAHTYLNLGKLDEALATANRAIVLRHGYLFGRVVKTAALAHGGQFAEAAASLRAIFDIAPDFSLAKLDHYPFVLDSQRKHLFSGLQKAGLPISVATAAPPIVESATLPLPDKPSIAVLPFENMSGDPEQDYFVDGLVEDIITGLSRNRELFVIARNSSFAYKGKSPDVREVGRELGVRYVLEGSVRKAGNRVRITGQLVEAISGGHLWADRFEGSLEDIFALQDQITSRVIGGIAPSLHTAEIERVNRKVGNLQAYDCYLRCLAATYRFSPEANEEALAYGRQAVLLDAEFSLAYMAIGYALLQRWSFRWSIDQAADRHEVEQAVRRALELDRQNAQILALCGQVMIVILGRIEEGAGLLDEAVTLDTNSAAAWRFHANAQIAKSAPEKALDDLQRVLRLSPLDPGKWYTLTLMARAYNLCGRYADARSSAAEALSNRPNFPHALIELIAANVLVGRLDVARESMATFRKIQPEERVSNYKPLGLPASGVAKYQEALRLAGLPE